MKLTLLGLLASASMLLAWVGFQAWQHEQLDESSAQALEPKATPAAPPASLGDILAHPDLVPTHHHALLGKPAPHFELADSAGTTWNFKRLCADGPVVVIFYYGFHCSHCATQLFDVNRDLPCFDEIGAQVVAISADPPELTRQRLQKYGPFAFPLLADPGNKAAHAYGVFKPETNSLRHGTFLVDRARIVRWVNVGDAPFRRNAALLCELAKMEGG